MIMCRREASLNMVIERLQQNWKEQMPYMQNMGGNVRLKEELAEATIFAIQDRLRKGWQKRVCSAARDGELTEESFATSLVGSVTYYGLDSEGTLELFNWKCRSRGITESPHALHHGCFPSTPIHPHIRYDLKLSATCRNACMDL